MTKLTVAQTKTIEEYWSDIPSLKEQLCFREWQLTENKRADDNTGGGRSSHISDPTAQKAILLASDEKYLHLKKNVESIEKVLKEINENKRLHLLKQFADLKYLSGDSRYSDWEDVAYELGIGKAKAYKLRNKLIDMTAQKLGWL